MTRNDAIEKCYSHWGKSSAGVVDSLVALGVLKLEEPKSHYALMQEKLPGVLWPWVHEKGSFDDFLLRIERAGLRIVDARSQGEG